MKTMLLNTSFRLRPSIVGMFLLLCVPLFVATVWVIYATNDRIARETANETMERVRLDTFESTTALLEPIKSLVKIAAALGSADPAFFRSPHSSAYLTEMLAHSANINSVYVAYLDGSFRMSLLVSPTTRILDKNPPAGAHMATRWLDRKGGGSAPHDHYWFFDADGKRVGDATARATYDPRVRPWFKEAVAGGNKLAMSEPYIFATTGVPGITITMPFYANGQIAGVVAADITLDNLSRFLAANPVSKGSITLIVDDDERIIAHPDLGQSVRRDNGKLIQNTLAKLSSDVPAFAMASRPDRDVERFTFHHGQSGEEYVAMFSSLPAALGKPWRVMIIAPLSDFSNKLNENNQKLLIFGVIALLIEIVLIGVQARMIAKPIEQLERKVLAVKDLTSTSSLTIRSRISEINSLIQAVNKLDSTIRAFSAFVPKDLVRKLMNSDQQLELGGRSRFLTILFSDLESFSTLSETVPAQELLTRVSAYLDAFTHEVNKQFGTIDKFIGDAVMAFWGAPNILNDHAYHSCVAALRALRRMDVLNAEWEAQGLAPLRVRIGIHSDSVLVGNIGSIERMSYTVMGDGVNLASRLEGTNKDYGTHVCVSHAVFKEAGERLWLRPIDIVTVKGRRSEMQIYELIGIRGGDPDLEATPQQIRQIKLTQVAYELFRNGDKSAAEAAYRALLGEFPDDPLAKAMIGLCQEGSVVHEHH